MNDKKHSCGYRPIIDALLMQPCPARELQGLIGCTTDRGSFNNAYDTFFPFTIGVNQYYLGHSSNGRWFIQEILPDGTEGAEIGNGNWGRYYKSLAPYQTAAGRQFVYAYSHVDGKSYEFVREILPGGKMGNETFTNQFQGKYEFMIAYSIAGKHYLYGYGKSSVTGNGMWFIQELLPDGKTGKGKDKASNITWGLTYYKTAPFEIGGRQFFFSYSSENKKWIIREFLPGGLMGNETDSGAWPDEVYKAVFTFSYDRRTLLYRQGTNTSKKHVWFTQELLPGGRMGKVTGQGELDKGHSAAFAFSMNRKHFFYGFDDTDKSWSIQELL